MLAATRGVAASRVTEPAGNTGTEQPRHGKTDRCFSFAVMLAAILAALVVFLLRRFGIPESLEQQERVAHSSENTVCGGDKSEFLVM